MAAALALFLALALQSASALSVTVVGAQQPAGVLHDAGSTPADNSPATGERSRFAGFLAAVHADGLALLGQAHKADLHLWAVLTGKRASAEIEKNLKQEPLEAEDVQQDVKSVSQAWPERILHTIVWVAFSVIAALAYNKYKPVPVLNPDLNKEAEQEKYRTWQFGVFSCIKSPDPEVCFMSCCCPAALAAYTLSLIQLAPYWVAFSILLACMALSWLTMDLSGIVLVLVFTYYRFQVRKTFDMEISSMAVVGDCCCYLWCQPCTIAQEALQIRAAAECGHPAVQIPKEAPVADP